MSEVTPGSESAKPSFMVRLHEDGSPLSIQVSDIYPDAMKGSGSAASTFNPKLDSSPEPGSIVRVDSFTGQKYFRVMAGGPRYGGSFPNSVYVEPINPTQDQIDEAAKLRQLLTPSNKPEKKEGKA
jgi:hypothetical protein